MLASAQRQFGRVLPVAEMGAFISPSAEAAYKVGKTDATRLLYDGYAAIAFGLVSGADTFIALLNEIDERVKVTLEAIDPSELELRRFAWEERARHRAKPTSLQRMLRRIRFLCQNRFVTTPIDRTPSSEIGRKIEAVSAAKTQTNRFRAAVTIDPSKRIRPFSPLDTDKNPAPGNESSIRSPDQDAPGPDNTSPVVDERRKLLADFKSRGRSAGIRVTDEMIAKAANKRWNDRTMVTWWKRNDPRSTPAHDKMIRAVLAKDPSSIWHPNIKPKRKQT